MYIIYKIAYTYKHIIICMYAHTRKHMSDSCGGAHGESTNDPLLQMLNALNPQCLMSSQQQKGCVLGNMIIWG